MGSHYQRHLDWLITMAKSPGFKGQAWHRAKELDANPSGLWAGISADLLSRIGSERTSESVSPSQPKSRSVSTK